MKDVGFDVFFCMKVEASAAEVERFVARIFSSDERVVLPYGAPLFPVDGTLRCGPHFEPQSADERTIAYRAKRAGGDLYLSEGAVVENGYLYYWALSL